MGDAFRVDPVRQARADLPAHRDVGRLQPGDRGGKRADRHDLVGIAMDQEDRRPAPHLGRQRSAPSSAPEKPSTAATGAAAAAPHRATSWCPARTPPARAGASSRPCRASSSSRNASSIGAAACTPRSSASGGGPAGRTTGSRTAPCRRARARSARRRRRAAGTRQRRRQADQVVAVGADAVQQHDQLSCVPPLRGATRGPESRLISTPAIIKTAKAHRALAKRAIRDNDRHARSIASPVRVSA